jgi:hypothetical protein
VENPRSCPAKRKARRRVKFKSGPGHPARPFLQLLILGFRQRAEHVKDKPTLRGRRVEGFGQAAKADTSQSQFLDGFDQLLHRARQAVELPYDGFLYAKVRNAT